MSGKGSKRRPQQISNEEAELRFKLIFASEPDKHIILGKLIMIQLKLLRL